MGSRSSPSSPGNDVGAWNRGEAESTVAFAPGILGAGPAQGWVSAVCLSLRKEPGVMAVPLKLGSTFL